MILRTGVLVGVIIANVGGCSQQPATPDKNPLATNTVEPLPIDFSKPDTAAGVESGKESRGIEHRVEREPVTATLKLENASVKAGQTITLTVELDVEPLWDIRTLDAIPMEVATRLEPDLPIGMEAQGVWLAPVPSRSHSPDAHLVYSDLAVFTRPITIDERITKGRHEVKLRVSYLVCNDRKCLRQPPIELRGTLHVE